MAFAMRSLPVPFSPSIKIFASVGATFTKYKKISLEEYKDTIEEVYCKIDNTLVQGLEYVNGDYTYRYMKQ